MADAPDQVTGPPALPVINSLLNKTLGKNLIGNFPTLEARLKSLRQAAALANSPDASLAVLALLGLSDVLVQGAFTLFCVL